MCIHFLLFPFQFFQKRLFISIKHVSIGMAVSILPRVSNVRKGTASYQDEKASHFYMIVSLHYYSENMC